MEERPCKNVKVGIAPDFTPEFKDETLEEAIIKFNGATANALVIFNTDMAASRQRIEEEQKAMQHRSNCMKEYLILRQKQYDELLNTFEDIV